MNGGNALMFIYQHIIFYCIFQVREEVICIHGNTSVIACVYVGESLYEI